MGKHAKKSKHSDMESEQSDSSSSSSEVEQKHKSKKHDNAIKGKHSQTNNKKSRDSSSASSSTDSESDSSNESVKERKSHKSQAQEVKKTKSGSKWDSPVEKRRHSSPVHTESKRRDERDARSKRDQRDYGRNDYRDKRDERDYKPRRNDFTDRHRNERGRSRENRNFRNDKLRDERDRSRERVRETRNRSNDRWPQGRDNQRRGRQANSRSPSPRRNARRQQRSRSRDRGDGNHSWGKKSEGNDRRPDKKPQQKEEPNFGLSGALTEDTNKVNGVVVKYSEPLEARRPKRRWRLYPFKGETALPVLHIHRQSCFLVGRERKVVDLAVDHPSCSKQHAALQYRLVPFTREDGSQGKRVRLYLIDLDSANGTFLNNKKIEARKYYELFEKDVIKFGFSTREYVLLHENSQEDQEDDDVTIKKEEPED